MKIKFIGTGGAFEPEYFNSAALLTFNNKTFLIDAGFTVYPRLMALGLFFKIDYILLTHLHNDHCGSLANILLHKCFHDRGRKFTILYQTEKFKKQLEDFLVIQLKDPAKYVDFAPLETVSGISALDTFGRHSEGFQTYSFIFEAPNERLVYSGDLGQADFLFAHLQTLPACPTIVFHDITFNAQNDGHAHYTMLQPYQSQHRLFGYHCNPTQNPPDNTIPLVADQPEFVYSL
ncbi:MAG: fold metallo-hydrolase [Adhaeribacter sp.]|jgi:ribonuclease BN (tRNA processing enzyme)|nr:fold metallo-hydrolase [Adhaeribacter sp.]